MRSSFVLALLAFAMTACSSKGDALDLHLQVEEGSTRSGRLSVQSVADLRLGLKAQMQLDMSTNLEQEFLPMDGALQPVRLRLDDVQLDFGIEQSIVQSKEVDEQLDNMDLSELEANYNGRDVILFYDEHARIERIEGLEDDLGAEALDSIRSGIANVEKLLGKDFFRRLSGFLAVLPESPVRIGDTWENNFRQDILGLPVLLETEYRLAERENGLAHIDLNGRFETDTMRLSNSNIEFPFEGFEMASGNISVLMRGTQRGRISVEEQSGWTQRSDIQQNFDLEFRIGLFSVPVALTNRIQLEPATDSTAPQ
jgi:hypothetical protein